MFKHLLSSADLSRDDLMAIFEEAEKMLPIARQEESSELMKGKVLATLFYEPSTRTRFSFETAMLRLGGSVISNFQMNETSSAKKGETFFDTGKVVSRFADVIAMRHPESGTVASLAEGSEVPVLNGGDGPNDHPTQGLLDVFTIWREFGKVDGLTIGMVGDLKYGRVPHAQCELLKNFSGLKFVFVSPEALKMPAKIVEMLREVGHEVVETEDLDAVVPELDVLALTRIQGERFESEEEYLKYKGVYQVGREQIANSREGLIVMHPLPRVDELSTDLDDDSRSRYFDQVTNGVAVRMAVIRMVIEG